MTANTKTKTTSYKVTRGTIGRIEDGDSKFYHKGDTVELTADEAKKYSTRIEAVGDTNQTPAATPDDGDDGGDDSGDGGDTHDWSILADLHWRDAVQTVNGLETAEDVQSAREAEVAGKNRSSVIEAADTRLAQLGGSEAEAEAEE